MKKKIATVIFVIALGVFLFSGFKLYQMYMGYKTGEDLYDKTADEVVKETDDDADEDTAEKPPIKVDFDKLLKENPDTVGWIYCADTVIDYPVVKKDDKYYLHRMFNGKKNVNGTIFVEEANSDIFQDDNTVVYGHHMKNGSMFASLQKYKKEDDYLEKHPVFWFLTPDKNYKLEVFASYTANAYDDTYTLQFSSDEDFEKWIEAAKKKSDIKTDVEVTTDDHLVTLSTCAYNFKNARYVVMCKLVEP